MYVTPVTPGAGPVILCVAVWTKTCIPSSAGLPGKNTPPKFNIDPEKWWLEDKPFLLGFGYFSGANCSISGWYQESQRSCIITFNHGSLSEHRTMALIRSC